MQHLDVQPRISGQRTELLFSDRPGPIWWDWEGPEGWALPPPVNANWAAILGMAIAQRRGGVMHVAGAVDRRLLENLERFSQVWAQWLPGYFFPVDITAERETAGAANRDGEWAFALSGGIDGTFCLLRHARGLAGRENRKPAWGVTINGYTKRPAAGPGFDEFKAATAAIAAAAGIPQLVVSTNWTDLGIDKSMQYQLPVAVALHQLGGVCRGGVIGADDTYEEEFAAHPHGSNCYTNPLLAGGDFELLTWGGAFNRIEKVAWLMNEPAVAPHLRVCWNAGSTGRNCGRCEKCVRTAAMAFAATGNRRAAMFDRPMTAAAILSTRIKGKMGILYWKQLRPHLKARYWQERLAVSVVILLGRIRVLVRRFTGK